MSNRNWWLADPAVSLATALLLLVLGCRVVLAWFAAPPLSANALLAPAAAADSVRLVLVVDERDRDAAGAAARRVRRTEPRRPLEVHRVPWSVAGDPHSRAGRIAALVRAYGHSELPVLLTVGPEAQVVRMQSVPEGGE